MKRLLLVTSSYAPVMIADMQRARMLAWDLPAVGWEVEVLAPNEELQRKGTIQPESNRLFNPDVIAHSLAPDEALLLQLARFKRSSRACLQARELPNKLASLESSSREREASSRA